MSDTLDSDFDRYYYVTQRCRLCRFLFEEGCMVVADIDGRRSEPYCYENCVTTHYDGDVDAVIRDFVECDDSLTAHRPAAGYHESCLAIVGTLPPPGFDEVSEYTFTPPLAEERRRKDRTQLFLCRRLQEQMSDAALPAELWSMVAGHLVQACAASTLYERWRHRDSSQSTETQLDLSQGVWANYVYIDGARYVSQLTNVPADTLDCIQLFDGQRETSTLAVYVLEDYLGIRQLVFADAERDLAELVLSTAGETSGDANTLWWHVILFRSNKATLRTESDGVKLRFVGKRRTRKHMVWQVPMLASRITSHPTYLFEPQSPDPATETGPWRMASFVCNDPDVTGYSAFWNGHLVAIHAHQRFSENMSFYRYFADMCPGTGVWLHFPLAEGERVIRIFIRGGCEADRMGLLFQTTRGRNLVMGPVVSDVGYGHLCSLPPDQPSRVYYNTSICLGIRRLRVDHATGDNSQPPFCPAMLTYSHRRALFGGYFVATVSLDRVACITPSYRTFYFSHCQVEVLCGLLLEYADGRPRACLGEFCFDHMGEAIDMSLAKALYFGYSRDRRVPPFWSRVSLDPAADGSADWKPVTPWKEAIGGIPNGTIEWKAVAPWKGTAEMWFSCRESTLPYVAPDLELEAVLKKKNID